MSISQLSAFYSNQGGTVKLYSDGTDIKVTVNDQERWYSNWGADPASALRNAASKACNSFGIEFDHAQLVIVAASNSDVRHSMRAIA